MMPSLHIGEINSGIHMYQFTFETLTPLFSDVVVVSDLKKHFGESTDLVKKWYGSADLHTYPYSIPSFKIDVRPFHDLPCKQVKRRQRHVFSLLKRNFRNLILN